MARTLASTITQVRYQLQDSDAADYRWSDEQLVSTLNAALLSVWQLRPDLFLSSGWTLPEYSTANLGDSTTLPVDDQYFTTVVKMTVGLVQLENDSISPDAKAATLLVMARTELQGMGG